MVSPPAAVVPPFSLDLPRSAGLAEALVEAIREHDRAATALLLALTNCVWALRDQDMLPENVVITMKALLRHSASRSGPYARDDLAVLDHWMDDLVSWCIGEYFRVDTGSSTGPEGLS